MKFILEFACLSQSSGILTVFMYCCSEVWPRGINSLDYMFYHTSNSQESSMFTNNIPCLQCKLPCMITLRTNQVGEYNTQPWLHGYGKNARNATKEDTEKNP